MCIRDRNLRVSVSAADCWTEWASIKHTSDTILALCCKRLLSMKVHAKKKRCQETCQHMMQQIICKAHKMQEGHTLTKLSNVHNSCYCSWLLTLPNYIQHDSKIIILTTALRHFTNQRTPVLLKNNKILSETSNLWVTKICGKHLANPLCCY